MWRLELAQKYSPPMLTQCAFCAAIACTSSTTSMPKQLQTARPWSNSNTRRASVMRAVIIQGFLRWLSGRNCTMVEPYGFTFYTAGETARAPRRPWSNSNTRRASALRAVITQGFLRGLGGRNCLMAEPYGFTFYTAGETPALISANLAMPPSYHG